MTDEQATRLFDDLASRDFNPHDYNRWGVTYFDAREDWRRQNPGSPEPLNAADARVVDELGDDPDQLFLFCTATTSAASSCTASAWNTAM